MYTSSSGKTTRGDLYYYFCVVCSVLVHLESSGTRLCCSCNARNIFIHLYSVLVSQSLVIKFQILKFCIFLYYMILEIETLVFKFDAYRRLSTVLDNAYVWCPFGLVQF